MRAARWFLCSGLLVLGLLLAGLLPVWGDILDDAKAKRAIEAQRIEKLVRDALAKAVRLEKTSPSDAQEVLRITRAILETDTALAQERRESLIRQVRLFARQIATDIAEGKQPAPAKEPERGGEVPLKRPDPFPRELLWPQSNFSAYEPMVAAILFATKVSLYEGLPHQHREAGLLKQELKTKKTVEIHDFPFYQELLPLTKEDGQKLKDLFCSSRSFTELRGMKHCCVFHPDYCIEWQDGKDIYQILICLGCGEARCYSPKAEMYCDIQSQAREKFRAVLTPYRKNRPPSDAQARRLAKPLPVRALYDTEPERNLVGFALPPIKFNSEAIKALAHVPQFRRLEYREGEINAEQIKTLAMLPALEALDLRYTTLQDRDVAALAALPRLRSLRLASSRFTDATLKELSRLKELHELALDLNEAPVTEKGLETLAGLAQLRKLTLRVQRISNQVTKVLAALPQLQELSLEGKEFRQDALKELVQCKSLEKLSLYSWDIEDAVLRDLPGLKNLRSISLRSDVGDGVLKLLPRMDALQEVHILYSRRGTDAGIKELANCKQLRKLSLKDIRQVTDASLADISRLKQLEYLAVEVADLSDARGKELASLPALRHLELRGKVSGAGLRALASLRQLQELDLSPCTGLTDEAVKELTAFKELRKLNLSRTGIDDAGLKQLVALPELQCLRLDSTSITDAGLAALPAMGKLQTLGLCDTRITDKGIKILTACPQLRTLDLAGSQVTEAGEVWLGKELPELWIIDIPRQSGYVAPVSKP